MAARTQTHAGGSTVKSVVPSAPPARWLAKSRHDRTCSTLDPAWVQPTVDTGISSAFPHGQQLLDAHQRRAKIPRSGDHAASIFGGLGDDRRRPFCLQGVPRAQAWAHEMRDEKVPASGGPTPLEHLSTGYGGKIRDTETFTSHVSSWGLGIVIRPRRRLPLLLDRERRPPLSHLHDRWQAVPMHRTTIRPVVQPCCVLPNYGNSDAPTTFSGRRSQARPTVASTMATASRSAHATTTSELHGPEVPPVRGRLSHPVPKPRGGLRGQGSNRPCSGIPGAGTPTWQGRLGANPDALPSGIRSLIPEGTVHCTTTESRQTSTRSQQDYLLGAITPTMDPGYRACSIHRAGAISTISNTACTAVPARAVRGHVTAPQLAIRCSTQQAISQGSAMVGRHRSPASAAGNISGGHHGHALHGRFNAWLGRGLEQADVCTWHLDTRATHHAHHVLGAARDRSLRDGASASAGQPTNSPLLRQPGCRPYHQKLHFTGSCCIIIVPGVRTCAFNLL